MDTLREGEATSSSISASFVEAKVFRRGWLFGLQASPQAGWTEFFTDLPPLSTSATASIG